LDRLSDYDFDLPERLIAQTPLADRAASRLLHLDRASGLVRHRQFREVVEILEPGDVLVLNDTRVDALRIVGSKPETGGQIEALLLHRREPDEYEALVKPGKRARPGTRVDFGGLLGEIGEDLGDGIRVVRFPTGSRSTLERIGETPLPPYIHERLSDAERYQTAYAQHSGSAAAPTAGLHFTPEILDALRAKGVRVEFVTLHVGIDTFRPVSVENLEDHEMHGEVCTVPSQTADAIAAATGRIIAVGTTTVRTLESFASDGRKVETGTKTTKAFIRPGYRFRVVDGMFTNFHLPRTTMLAMISAMAGREAIFRAYAEAVREEYRFLSFGDSMLIL